jgi:hypothetical protein
MKFVTGHALGILLGVVLAEAYRMKSGKKGS